MTQMHTTWRDVDVSAYVDGELDPAAQAAFEAALVQDRALQQKVKAMREVVALVRAVPLREPPRNYLLTPSMVAERSVTEKPPQPVKRWPASLLFMRLATSMAAVAFVITAGLTYMQRGISPGMLTQAPKAADEMPVMEAPRAVVATVEVFEEAEVMLASEPEAMPVPDAGIEEDAQAEKVVEAEEGTKALGPVPFTATPQPDAGVDQNVAMVAQEMEEPAPPAEALAPESAPAAETEVADEVERAKNDATGAVSETGAGAQEEMAYDAAEPALEAYHAPVNVRQSQRPSWWLPVLLGAATLLLAGITYWMSRRR